MLLEEVAIIAQAVTKEPITVTMIVPPACRQRRIA
jgi:hypothetical protein